MKVGCIGQISMQELGRNGSTSSKETKSKGCS
jgi:hypothetical protein